MNNKIYFKDKVAIVTGASSGIGLATATLLAKYQAKVVLAARSEDKLNELSRQLSQYSEVISVKTDVSNQEECRILIEKTIQKFGRIDMHIHAGNVQRSGPQRHTSPYGRQFLGHGLLHQICSPVSA